MRTVIFDFDGTLADSFTVVIEIAHELTGRSEFVDPAEIERLRKLRLLDVAKALRLPKWRWPLLLLSGRRKMTQRLGEVKPFPGIIEVLKSLKADHFNLMIMSSNSEANVKKFLTSYNMNSYFDKVYGGVGILGKARALKKILRKHNLQASEAMYVGDEPRDIIGAKEVGMSCVAVAWGYNAPNVLLEQKPTVLAKTMSQLQTALQDWGVGS